MYNKEEFLEIANRLHRRCNDYYGETITDIIRIELMNGKRDYEGFYGYREGCLNFYVYVSLEIKGEPAGGTGVVISISDTEVTFSRGTNASESIKFD